MSVGCFTQDCVEVVRGQCPGYNKSGCGRYYCAHHSGDGFCESCYADKVIDETIDRYDAIAKTIKASDLRVDRNPSKYGIPKEVNIVGTTIFYGIFLAIVLTLLLFLIDRAAPVTIAFCGGISFLLAYAFALWCRKLSKRIFANDPVEIELSRYDTICKDNPRFHEFYQEWKKEKNRQRLVTAVRIVAGVATAAHSYNEDRKDREIKNAAYSAAKKYNRNR